jgi:hypothetical protein
VDLKAARLKLNPGMALASARAMVHELNVAEADEPADANCARNRRWCDAARSSRSMAWTDCCST